jgi:hypothetical protein
VIGIINYVLVRLKKIKEFNTHVLLRYVAFEEIRRETWTDPLTGEFRRPSSISQLLGNPRWGKRLLKLLQHTKVGRIWPDLLDDEIRR